MKVIWAIICEGSSTDVDNNNVTLFNIYEELHLLEPPIEEADSENLRMFPIRFVYMASLTRSDINRAESHEARLAIVLPDGRQAVADPRFTVDLDSAPTSRIKIEIDAIPLAEEGEYSFQMQSLDDHGSWHSLSETPLRIYFQEPE